MICEHRVGKSTRHAAKPARLPLCQLELERTAGVDHLTRPYDVGSNISPTEANWQILIEDKGPVCVAGERVYAARQIYGLVYKPEQISTHTRVNQI